LLFEAARWAPSAFNNQPWRFIFADKKNKSELFDKIFDSLVPQNQVWAKNAPLLVVNIALKKYETKDSENPNAAFELGMAVGNLLGQATAMGLHARQMAGFSKEKLIQNLMLPEKYNPITVMAVGYRGKPKHLSENLKKMEPEFAERTRKPLIDLFIPN